MQYAPLSRGHYRFHEGPYDRRQSDYAITAILPHLQTPELLKSCIPLLQLQSDSPFIILVDTGSNEETMQGLYADWATAGISVNSIRANSYLYASMPVAVALDLGMQLCQTEYAFFTHTDCFLRRRDLLEFMKSSCCARNPAVGYEISPRNPVTDDWQGMVGHTCLMLHMPTIREYGITWDMQRCMLRHDLKRRNDLRGWPDTETGINLEFYANGIHPEIIGRERNRLRHTDGNIDHLRSYTGVMAHGALSDQQRVALSQAQSEAMARIQQWQRESLTWD